MNRTSRIRPSRFARLGPAAVLALVAVFAALGACAESPDRGIAALDVDGLRARVESSTARAVLLDFWTSW